MENSKNEWSKPEIIILDRSTPEEVVLLACKANLPTGCYVTNKENQLVPTSDFIGS